ncbi:MAG: hypothetical protein K8H86_00835, partial [Ignavibacteriaceae bacterium]|nr:hypothetical protein [Ignavibacteriaceae bacterium]
MRKLYSIVILLIAFFVQTNYAQLTGTKTIPGDYATIQAAVTTLNTSGVGAGGVTFNVAAAYMEPIGAPILLTATGTSANPIVFQKSGAGANPSILRTDAGTLATTTLGGQGDAVVIIEGSDYVTFDGFDIGTSDQGIEYGYYLRKAGGTDGCKNVTIKNSVIVMTKGTSAYVAGIYSSNNDAASLVSSATGITVTSTDGRNENNTFTGNTINNVFSGIVLRGFGSATPYDFFDQNVVVGSVGTGNTIQNFAGNAAGSAYGVYLIYQNNANVSYNTINNTANGGSPATGTFYGIFSSTSATGSLTASYNNINLTNSGPTSATYGINNSATGNLNISNNTIQLSNTITTTGAFGFIYNSSAAASTTVSINDNTFTGSTIPTTGSTYLIYNNSSQLTPGVTTVYNNTVSGTMNRTGASGTFYCYYNNGSPTGTENVYDNTFSNIALAGTAAFYGILSTTGSSHTHNIYNNTVNDVTGGTGTMYGIHRTLASGSIYNNTVYNFSGGGTIHGLSCGSGSVSIYKNSVYNLSSSSTGTTAGTVNGIYISGTTNTYIFNNIISDLTAPSSAGIDAIRGISSTGTTASSNLGLYYNTIFLNASSTGVNFGTSGIFATTSAVATSAALDMRNNIVVNNSTAAGTGVTAAYRRSTSALTNFSSISNNNDYFAGTPSATNLIFFDGTNSDQTIADYKTRVTPADGSSFTENAPFINSAIAPYNLHINPAVATQLESGASPVSVPVAITTDFDGNTRNATLPDVGADEFTGIMLDLTAPTISYSPLLNTSSTNSRTLVVTVTDASGVPTAAPGWPMLYWIKTGGSWTPQQPTSVAGSEYTYNFGAGTATGDVVSYYVVAQDGATTPNVGASPSLGAGGFTANPPAASTPPTTPNSYTITAVSLAGDYTVGLALFNRISGKNVTFEKSVTRVVKEVTIPLPGDVTAVEKGNEVENSQTEISDQNSGVTQMVEVEEISWIPMENGLPYTGDLFVKKSENPSLNFPMGIEGIYTTITAALADLNLRGVSGATNFLLVDAAYPSETFPLSVNISNENLPTATNTVTVKCSSGVTSSVTGAGASTPLFIIRNSYVTIDGSNSGGTDRSLTIENTSATSPSVLRILSSGTTPVMNVTVKNCNLINGANTSSALVITDVAGTAGYFNNITIQNNSVQKAYIGIYCFAVVAAGNGSGLLLTGNDLNTSGANAIRLAGLYVQGVDGATVTNNNVGNFTTSDASNITGVWFATGTINSTITNNTFGPIVSTTGAPRGIAVSSAFANSNITIAGNTVTGLTTSYSSAPYGIYVFSTTTGVTVSENKVGNILNSNTGGYGARGIHVNTGLAASNITIQNNFVWDVKATSDVSATYWVIGIGVEGATGGVNVFNNSVNLFGSLFGYSSASISTAFGVLTSTANTLDVRNNIFVNSYDNTNSATDKAYSIYSNAANTAFTDINHNNYFVSGVPGILGYLGANDSTLIQWQTATGKDLQSLNETAPFVDSTNLHIPDATVTLLESGAQPIAGVVLDIDGDTRNTTRPDIGADEFGGINPTMTIGWANLQWPASGTILQGGDFNVYAQIWVDGVTPGPGAGPGITAYIGYSTTNSNPNTWTNWMPATYNSENGNNDEFMANIGTTLVPGTYYYASKFQRNNGPEYYGGYNVGGGGAWDGTTNVSGTLTVNSPTLAGDYYIPQGANPQGFTSLADAITDLNSYGVSAPVRFLIDGDLDEVGANLVITRNDLTSTNNLVIKPAAAKTPAITITGCVSTAGASQYSGMAISGASFITIDGSNLASGSTRDLTINMNDSLNGRVGITLYGNTDNILFKNFNLKFNKINLTSTSTRGIYGNGQASGVVDSLVIENCKIGDMTYAPAYAISITGSSGSSLYASKTYVQNNELYGIMRPVYFYFGGAAGTVSEISGNEIKAPYAPPSGNVVWGMLFNNYNGTFNIYGNKLQTLISASSATNGVYGIGTLSAQPAVVMNIYNNFLGGNIQHTGTGVPASVDVISFQDNIPQANVSFNTIVLNDINKPTATRLTGIRWGGTANVNIKDNIVINNNDAATAYALYAAVGTFTSDYNDLYVSGALANVGYYLNQALKTFSAWKDTTGKDANSLNIDAPFTSATDFHIPASTVTPLESAGIPVAGISTDIDGQARSGSNPDIGADEFAGFSPLAAPSSLLAISNQTKKVNVSWTDNTSSETGFILERKTGDSLSAAPYSVIAALAADAIAYLDTLVQDTTLYTYRVKAVQNSVSSPYSNSATVMTLIPVELTSFAAQAGDNSINISWSTATEKNNRGFDIERKLENGWEKIGQQEGKGTSLEISNYTFIDNFKYKSFKGTVEYRLKQIDFDGTYTYSQVVSVDVDFTPKEYSLYQNYPNPFNPSTTIKFALPFESKVRVIIYSITGELVEELVNTVHAAGVYDVQFNAGRHASGVYIYSIDAQSVDGSKKFN